jgi:hypothetical protein
VPKSTGSLQPPDLPLSFREEIVPRVFAAVAEGWSVALVGLPGTGLSNLLRFMVEPRVSAHFLNEAAPGALTVFVEADRWSEPAAVFPAIARALLDAAHAHQWPRAEQAALRHLVEEVAARALPQPATPLVELLAHVCGGLGRRVVLLCDEFDSAWAQVLAAPLRELRALRDAHKYHLTFVIGLQAEPSASLSHLPGSSGAAKFFELFATHTYPLRPYSPADTRVALARKTLGWNPPLTPDEAEGLHRATGGHAKLLMAALAVLDNRRQLPWANVERALLSDPAVVETCRALWLDLPPAERLAVWRLSREHLDALSETALARLRLRGLAVGGPPSVFSSLFESFVAGQPEPEEAAPEPPSPLRDPGATPMW